MVLSSSNSSAFAQQYSNGMPPTYGISELSPSNAINQSVLFSATRGDLSVSALEGFIEQKLLPFDIRLVLLDIGKKFLLDEPFQGRNRKVASGG